MFKPVVHDYGMFEAVYSEVLQPNLDSCMVFLTVLKEEFEDLKTKNVYEMLIMLPKLEAEELELMFVQDDEDENEEIDELDEESDLGQEIARRMNEGHPNEALELSEKL